MPKYAKVTQDIVNKYNDYVEQGKTKTEACRLLNVAPSTLRDFIKRNSDNSLKEVHEYFVIRRNGSIGIAVDEKIFTIKYDSKFYKDNEKLINSLAYRDSYFMTKTELRSINLSTVEETFAPLIADKSIELKGGKAFYKGFEISRELFNLIKDAKKNNPNSNILKFAERMIQNPDKDVIRQLHPFLTAHSDIEICKNGYVLAYKSVRADMTDHYSGKFSNEVGKYVEMNREEVDNNPNVTCSYGLHVGSLSYIKRMYSHGVIVKCIIHPKDFVSIPTDYNGAKARVCRYKVVGIHSK